LRWVSLYYLSWVVFGTVGILLNLACMALMILPGRDTLGRPVRATIRRLFKAWAAWLHATKVISVAWEGFGQGELQPGTVYIANHPTIIDATLVLARLPDAICIFKPSLMSNPAVGPAAVMAGYVRGDTGLDLIKAAAWKVAEGQSLLVFPEGTRTAPGTDLGKMKPGFALIADRARAPVRLIVISSTPDLGARGRPWWPAPDVLPGALRISLEQSWPYEPGRSAAELTQAVEKRICEVLAARTAR
jgi:1-acyl-sn-glycerol-3-phosphate acyltransferase